MSSKLQLFNPFLRTYLAYTENTEPPELMHMWSAISCASACMGRHVWYPFGLKPIYGNMFILLVGPPATRKSTALETAVDLVMDTTEVNIAPEDTAGQRQGLLTALGAEETAAESAVNSLPDGVKLTEEDKASFGWKVDPDKHALFIAAYEWGSFIGQNNLDLTRFLIRMYDGNNYTYQLKKIKAVLKSPIITMAGCTTPTDISSLLPPEAIGQGFMSRHILVFAAKKKRRISKPNLAREYEPYITDIFQWIWRDARGELVLSPEADMMIESIYEKNIHIADTRFVYYSERRQTHLMKLSSILACLRKSMVIERVDIEDAHALLLHTEQFMPDALGEYGLSALSKAKQRMVEFLKHANQPITHRVLWNIMQRDMRQRDFHEALQEMLNTGKLEEVATSNGKALVVPDDMSEVLGFMSDPVQLMREKFEQELVQ